MLLRSVGGSQEAAEASEHGDIESLPVEEKYKALLRLCVKLTHNAYKIMDEDIDALRTAGLTDDEILEGVVVACQFNAIDRLADTFGLYELMQLRDQS
jgi:alkylhydroperoxidase family enzyme